MKIDDIIKRSSAHFYVDHIKGDDLKPFVRKLTDAGYEEKNIFNRLDIGDIHNLMLKFIPIYLNFRMKENTHLDRFIRLFLFSHKVPIQEMEEIFDKGYLKFLTDIKIFKEEGDCISSYGNLFPCMGGYFYTDRIFTPVFLKNHVYPLGRDSYCLARGMIREPVDYSLDLCTGSGVQAITASFFSKRVVAVDINPRALNFARFNALLNDRHNIEFLKGDLFEPVQGEKFDRIFANPPFVPSPEDNIYFRDGKGNGEFILEKIIRGLPLHLKEKGISQIVTLLVFQEGRDYLEKVQEWLKEVDDSKNKVSIHSHQGEPRYPELVSGSIQHDRRTEGIQKKERDFILLVLATLYQRIEPYILGHIGFAHDYEEYSKTFTKWVQTYRENRIEKVADGLINIMRTSGKGRSELKDFNILTKDFSHIIKRTMDYMDILSLNENKDGDVPPQDRLYNRTYSLSPQVDLFWEGVSSEGRRYGVLFKPQSLYQEEFITEEEKVMLDIIAGHNHPVKGEQIKEEFIRRNKYSSPQGEEIFYKALINLLKNNVCVFGEEE